ncbi:hypothetical protein X742_35085 [Mesorhizobium sp. LNHC232B00]|nr:hypothetical protein X742_35085 [Mesorhizobium sp. LNHC232B00]
MHADALWHRLISISFETAIHARPAFKFPLDFFL